VLHKVTLVGATIFLLAMTSTEARAKVEVTAFGGFRTATSLGEGYYENNFAEKLTIAPGGGFGLSLGVPVGPEGRSGQQGLVELSFSYQESDFRFEPEDIDDFSEEVLENFEVEDGYIILGKLQVMYLQVGGAYRFGNYSGWLPFVNGGLGATFFSAPDGEAESKSKFSLSFGGGVDRALNEKFGLKLGLKGYMTSLPADEAYWIDPWGGVWAVTDDNWLFQGELQLGLTFKL
jgi:opacity protein-like surface antigen